MEWDSLRPLLAGDDAGRDRTIARLREFALELLRWNRGVSNLIAHDDEPRLVSRHLAECLSGRELINQLGCNRLVDFGSGGGFPGIPLALAGAGASWILVESRRNKTLFLRRAVEKLALHEVSVLTGRIETLIDEDPEALRCDGFASRATMKAGPTLALAARIVRSGGHAILWKGSGLTEELAAAPHDWQTQWETPVTHALAQQPSVIALFKRR